MAESIATADKYRHAKVRPLGNETFTPYDEGIGVVVQRRGGRDYSDYDDYDADADKVAQQSMVRARLAHQIRLYRGSRLAFKIART